MSSSDVIVPNSPVTPLDTAIHRLVTNIKLVAADVNSLPEPKRSQELATWVRVINDMAEDIADTYLQETDSLLVKL